jgi:hypothetical protein
MNMTNVRVLIKPDETQQDIIAEICDECNIKPDEHFAFSAIIAPDAKDPGYQRLKINCIEPAPANPYTPSTLVQKLYSIKPSNTGVRYVQPPLEQWIRVFRPFMSKLVSTVYPKYKLLIPERDELVSILNLTITKLYKQGYYLHKTLIKKSFVNDLNMYCRSVKNLPITDSLDAVMGTDDDDKDLTLLDTIADVESTEWARRAIQYTERDYWDDVFERIKACMLKDMSEFQFNRILTQLKTNTVDRSTSYKLDKYRQILNPGYVPRPNAKGKNRGGKKPQ